MPREKLIIIPKPPKGTYSHKRFTVRVPADITNVIEEIIAITGHSRNEIVNMFLKHAMENMDPRTGDYKSE